MSTDTQEILDRLKAVCEAATDGPWTTKGNTVLHDGYMCPLSRPCHDVAYCGTDDDEGIESDGANAQLIALSRTALPALVDALEAALSLYCRHCDGHGEVYDVGMAQAEYCSECGGDGFSGKSAGDILDAVDDALAPLKDKL